MTTARLVHPHQLFLEHLDVPPGTLLVLVEPDLFFRQFAFHAHKLVLHRAGLRAFQERLERAGHDTAYVDSSADRTSDDLLLDLLRDRGVTRVETFDVVDDW